jgi:phosphoribosylformylglycinamidine synthase subunit PurQ / glutaminase
MRFGVVQFPGTCDDRDALLACRQAGEAELLWHGDADLRGVDAVVIPGGFSYGDYLRVGAIARFSPVMEAVSAFAHAGGPVLGICNGFQVLCEAGLLPGALLPNLERRFICRQLAIEVVDARTPWTCALAEGQVLSIPAKHTTGRWYAPPELLGDVRVVFRYAADGNPNGSTNDVAGVASPAGNVVGLMPHPEHAIDALRGSVDGLGLFASAAAVPAGA